jgi:hypothetical protein
VARDPSLNGTRANLQESINTSALLAIYPGKGYATTNFLEADFWRATTSGQLVIRAQSGR